MGETRHRQAPSEPAVQMAALTLFIPELSVGKIALKR
jgi:hypothetical protein